MRTEPHEKHHASRPRAGDPVIYRSPVRGTVIGEVVRVEGNLCWTDYGDGEPGPFIWAFGDGLNKLHDWPTKARTDG